VDLAAAATRTPRWHEYGRPTTPVKVGRWPPASGGLKALTGIVVRPSLATKRGSTETCGLLKHALQFTFTEPNLTQTIGHPPQVTDLLRFIAYAGDCLLADHWFHRQYSNGLPTLLADGLCWRKQSHS
jgi:hypothetical protein